MNPVSPKPWVYELYTKAARSVPAYKAQLGPEQSRIRTSEEVLRFAPILDKKSYIIKHKFEALSAGGHLAPIMHASSGSSGTPTYWLRSFEQEYKVALDRQVIFQNYFGFKKTERTLVIVAFGMGIWVAGSMEANACKLLAEKHGWHITVATPGIEKKDIASILKHGANEYQNVVLVGFPAFIMDALQYCKKQHIRFNNRFRLLLAGEAISESFREAFIRTIHAPTPPEFLQVVNVYGSADVGQIGFETPISVLAQRIFAKHPELRTKVLGGTAYTAPALYQWNPNHIHIESHAGELLLTAPTGIPLIRYNIHDQGRVLTGIEIAQALKAHLSPAQFLQLKNTALPFVSHNGRTDVAVSYYAINIYPSHIQNALQTPGIKDAVTKSYFTRHYYSKTHTKETWEIYVEVKKPATKQVIAKIQKAITTTMLKVSIEYRKLFSTIGEAASPKIIPVTNIQDIPPQAFKRGMLYIHGKKPKMIT